MKFLYADDTSFNWLVLHEKHINSKQLKQKIQARQIIIVQINEQPVGWLRFGFFWDSIPFMNLLFILSDYRNKGIGSKLVAFWESEMQKQQYILVMTSTQSDETAQHFYRKLGYVDSGALLLENEPLELFFRKSLI